MRFLTLLLLSILALNSCDSGKFYGKNGQCNGITKEGKQCKNNADKSGYCGVHN